MMPFSILRVWGLGFLGWGLLGAAIYCGLQGFDEYRSNLSPNIVVPVIPLDDPKRPFTEPQSEGPPAEILIRQHTPSDPPRQLSGRFWTLLAATLALTGWSFGGFLPLRWLLPD